MKRLFVLFICFLCFSIASFAQVTETFDLATFKAPKGWNKQASQNSIQFSTANKEDYCLITLYTSIPGVGNLLYLERLRSLLGFPPTPAFDANAAKLYKIASECQKPYHVEGASEGASFKGDICSLNKPFVVNVDSQTGSGR
jgi:hypothetical protein